MESLKIKAGHGDLGEREWLDSNDVCRLLGISPRTLQTMRENGTLAYTCLLYTSLLQYKILFGYILLLIIIGCMAAVLFHERLSLIHI